MMMGKKGDLARRLDFISTIARGAAEGRRRPPLGDASLALQRRGTNMQAGGGADDRRVIEVGGLEVIVWAGTPGNPIIFVR